jgi:two-component sensor histidine kinase/HAMP domain-containing protein
LPSYYYAKKSLTQQALSQLESVASIQESRVEDTIDQNLERLTLVSSRTQLRFSLRDFIEESRPQYQDKMNRILDDARDSIAGLRDISILTLDGEVVASTNRTAIGSRHPDKDFFVRGKRENCADILFLDKNQNLRGILSGPLYLENRPLGVIAIEYSVDNIISLVKDYSGLGKTGETLLAKRDHNGDALFLTSLRFDPDAALRRRLSKDDVRSSITQALLKEEKVFKQATDYRGKPVLAGTRYIAETDWGLVVKIDHAEAFAPINHLRNLLGLTIFISSIVVIVVSLFIARSITRPVHLLVKGTEEIGRGNLDYRTEVKSKDELSILSQAFNEMVKNLREITASRDELNEEITERKKAEETLKQSIKEKELLMKEIYHRVKNNLAVVISLLRLQSGKIDDVKAKEVFIESENRVKAMSMIHERLYHSHDLSSINFSEYIRKLAIQLFQNYKFDSSKVKLSIDVPDVTIDIDTMISCGFIVNELISNAFKYAFPENREGELTVKLQKVSEHEYILIIKDNGVGFPEELDFRNTDSFGMQLLTLLTYQIGGILELNREGGTEFKIAFKEKHSKR